jgi:GTP pyrophosphokinase
MVSVQHKPPSLSGRKDVDIQSWLDALPHAFAPTETETIRQACELAAPLYAGQKELSGAPLLQHALGSASILAGMNMGYETIVAAILHAVPDHLENWRETLQDKFGGTIAALVGGISRMEKIREFSEVQGPDAQSKKKDDSAQQLESLRQMLLAMVEDIRVVLVKLAERTQTMRSLSGASEENRRMIAHETQSIFAPLANRLGVWQLKWELEDLALRYLEPQLYKKVAGLLDERRVEREQYIVEVVTQLEQELAQAGIHAEVKGRPKHICSIINKMKRKGVEFGELYDVRAVRILVENVKDCYTALGLVHNLWQPIPSEFDDYIARPKSNDYRSLHTAVIGPRELALEVQIRTHDMHEHAELGVAAHWRYKEGGKSDARFDEKIAWLRRILEWKEDMAESGDMLEQFSNELLHDRVYVLTPQGKVIDLPRGATPVDFAYALHTDVGHHTRGAKVDGNIVPLNYKLQNGQRVEILAAKQGAPSRDWLNPALGYLQSPRARAKVRHWFKMQHFDEDVAQGRTQLDRELHRLGVSSVNQEKIAQRLHYPKLEDLLAALGRNEVTQRQLTLAIQAEVPEVRPEAVTQPVTRPAATKEKAAGVIVEGVGNLQTRMARCCNPMPPDPIVGYVTRDRGITIHRSNCSFMQRLPEDRSGRLLAAQWGGGDGAAFAAGIEVEAHDRQGLLRDVGDLFAAEKVNVTRVDSQSRSGRAVMRFSVEVSNSEQLEHLLNLIRRMPGVVTARRL